MDIRDQGTYRYWPYFDFTRLHVYEQTYAMTLMMWLAGPALAFYSLGSIALFGVVAFGFIPEAEVELATLPPVFWLLLATSAPVWLAARTVWSLTRTGAMPPYPVRTARACWIAVVLAGMWLISLYPLYAEFQALGD